MVPLFATPITSLCWSSYANSSLRERVRRCEGVARDLPRAVIAFLEDEQFVVGVGDALFDRIHGHVPVRARPDECPVRSDLHYLLAAVSRVAERCHRGERDLH